MSHSGPAIVLRAERLTSSAVARAACRHAQAPAYCMLKAFKGFMRIVLYYPWASGWVAVVAGRLGTV